MLKIYCRIFTEQPRALHVYTQLATFISDKNEETI